MIARRATAGNQPGGLSGLVLALSPSSSPRPPSAHPFGPPPVARLDVRRHRGHHLVVGGGGRLHRPRRRAGGDRLPSRRSCTTPRGRLVEGTWHQPADQLARAGCHPRSSTEYLRGHVTVRQDGVTSARSRWMRAGLVGRGRPSLVAVVSSQPVEQLEIGVTLLQDLHPAYRTVGLVH